MQGAELWTGIAFGDVSLRELAGVDAPTIARIRSLGITAFTCGRHEQAAKIFAGLEALDPKDPKHSLHLAHALAALHRSYDAREAVTRFIEAAAKFEIARVELVRAHLFRASLELGLGNAGQAAREIALARVQAGDDPEAKALLARAGAAS